MKNVKFIIFFVFVILSLVSFGFTHESFQISAKFSLGFPQNEFKENVNQIGFSGAGHFLYNFPNSPVFMGISLDFLVYGSETREEPFNILVPDVLVDVTTSNNIFLCHYLFRIQPPKGRLRPYLDGLIGLNYLYTNTRVLSQKFTDDNPIARTNIYSDLVFSYGAGGGLMIEVFSKEKEKRGGFFVMYIDLSARYIKGGRAEYLKKASIHLENNQVLYDVSTSTTDLIAGYIGVSFSF